MKHFFLLVFCINFAGSLMGNDSLPVAKLNRTDPVDFSTEILPVFKKNCLACHNETKAKADLILETPEAILRGGDSGPAVVPGKPDVSFLFTTAAHIEDPIMPPPKNKSKAKNLNPVELALLKQWIAEGARGETRSYAPAPKNWIRDKENHTIVAIAVSPDGRYIACGRGHFIDIYDFKKRKFVTRLNDPSLNFGAHTDIVHSLSFAPDGTLASGGFREIKFWNRPAIESSDFDKEIPAKNSKITIEDKKATVGDKSVNHVTTIQSAAVSSDGLYIVTAAAKANATVWKLQENKKVADIDPVPHINQTFASLRYRESIENRLVSLYKARKDDREKALANEEELGQEAAEALAAAKVESKSNLDSAKRKLDSSIKNTADAAAKLAEAKYQLATAEKTRELLRAKADEWQKRRTAALQAAEIVGVTFSPDDSEVVIALRSGQLHLYSTDTGTHLETIDTEEELKEIAVFEKSIITTGKDGKKHDWPVFRDFGLQEVIGDGKDGDILIDRVSALSFSPDGKWLVSGSGVPTRSGTIQVWDAKTLKNTHSDTKAHEDTITAIRFNPQGKAFVTGSTDKFAKVFSLPSLERIHSLESHTGHVLSVDWSPEGLTIATASDDHYIKFWDVGIGEVRRAIKRGDYEVRALRFLSPNNDNVAAAFGDNTVKYEATNYEKSEGYSYALELTPDQKYVIAGGEDGVLRIWEAASRKLVTAFEPISRHNTIESGNESKADR